jgi:hypothetical protein
MEDARWLRKHRICIDLDQLAEAIEQGPGNAHPYFNPIGISYVVEGSLDLSAEVPCDPVRSFGDPQPGCAHRDTIGHSVKLGLEPFSQQSLVEARIRIRHACEATSSSGQLDAIGCTYAALTRALLKPIVIRIRPELHDCVGTM